LKVFAVGFGILVAAIVVNFLANYLGIETWHSFLSLIQKIGLLSAIKEKWQHLIFLVFIYPFVLGLAAYLVLNFFG